MGLLSTIVQLRAQQPLREAETKQKQQEIELEKLKQQYYKKLLGNKGLIDSVVEKSGMPANSVDELQQMITAAGATPGGKSVQEKGILDQIAGNLGSAVETTPQAPPVQQGENPLDSMSPFEMAMMKDFLGIDALGAGRNAETQRHNRVLEGAAETRVGQQTRSNDLRESQNLWTRQKHDEEPIAVTRQIPGGGTETVYVPRKELPTLKIGTQQRKGVMPIAEADIPLWVKPETLESPHFGITPDEAKKQGYRRISAGTREGIKSLATVGVITGQLRALMEDIFPRAETLLGRSIGAIKRSGGAALQTNESAAKFQKLSQGTLAPIIRALGEKGALSDSDVKRAIALLPKLTDDADVAWGAMDELDKLLTAAQGAMMGEAQQKKGAKMDADALIKKYGGK